MEGFNEAANQCFKCQHFGHLQSRCGANFRCRYYGEGHDSQKCPTHKLDGLNKPKPRCANCQGEHWASSHKCPKYKQIKTIIEDKNKEAPKQHIQNVPSLMNQRIRPTAQFRVNGTHLNTVHNGAVFMEAIRNIPPPTVGLERTYAQALGGAPPSLFCNIDWANRLLGGIWAFAKSSNATEMAHFKRGMANIWPDLRGF